MKTSLLRAPALALLLVLAASGCGTSPAKKRQEFLAEANRICKHFNDQQDQVRFPSVDPLSARTSFADRAEWGVSLKQIAYLGSQEAIELRKLKPPKDLRDRFESMVDLKDAAFADLFKGADAAKRNHRNQIKGPITAGRAKLARVSKLAKELDLQHCT